MMSLTQPDTRDIVLSEREWRQRVAEHAARVEPWVTPRLARREQGERHPVDDFLFDYYSWRPAQLARWHPGAGVILDGDVRDFEGVRGYAVDGAGARVDHATMTVDVMRGALGLLEATAARHAAYHCFGRHEWAMVYRQAPEEMRHSSWPLRVDQQAVEAVVESSPLRCTHVDAFRFYTDPARPLNTVQPTRATQIDLEQPGCLHATMDLYKWCFRSYPAVGADLTADCFDLARRVRAVDMRASPYDFTSLGYAPIPIETAEGRAEYVEYQRDFSQQGALLRDRLIEQLRRSLNLVATP
ncbi:MAG: 3-methyladenine DNA glycosylase [Candidatus Nanopelagicales bacterium]